MTKEIVLTEIEKSSETVNMYFKIKGNPFVLTYKFETVGCDPIDVSSIEERFDSSIITFIYFALTQGYDFRSEYPLSPELYYQLTEQFIPQMLRLYKDSNHRNQGRFVYHEPKIAAPLSSPKTARGWVGTGMSCGVDSLSAIYEYSQLCNLPGYRLTHLVCMKTGAHHGQRGFNRTREDRLFRVELERVKKFVDNTKIPLLITDTNLWEFVTDAFGAFGNFGYDRNHTFRTLGTVTLLQDFFSVYYFADAYGIDKLSVSVSNDCSTYERWFMPLLSTNNLKFYSADGGGNGRFGKTKLLVDYPPSYDTLHVCWLSGGNCGKCGKCVRTLVALDILGALDKYKNTFDIDAYMKDRARIIGRVIRRRNSDPFFNELCRHMPDEMKKLA